MKLLIIIPARGKSKGIPRKNIRLMNGHPLIYYSISSAYEIQKTYDADIVVDTDDTEIAEIVSNYGVEVVLRPAELADDKTTLDPVIFHALMETEQKHNTNYDIVITMQATSPTLKPLTILSAINKFVGEQYDTMISGVNDSHLSWKYDINNKLIPAYEKRVNRQQLPVSLKETGGFLITKRSLVTPNSRIGNNVTIFEVSANESIDIDTINDWSLCESILRSKRIILRADGEESLGMGHIYRTLSIAYHLTGHELLFVTKEQYKLGVTRIQESFFNYKLIANDNDFYKIIDEYKPDIVINDILDTDIDYMTKLKSMVPRIINFEDKGTGASLANCVVNALYPDSINGNCYNGFKYFFIRDEFLTVKPKAFSEEVKNITVMFGGSDPSNLTQKIYNVFKQIHPLYPNIDFHILTGFGYSHKNEIQDDLENYIYIHNDVTRVTKYLCEADLAITSQGRTIYELASMGVPAVVLAQNTRELEHSFAQFANGFINLGLGIEQDYDTITSTIEWLIKTPKVRKEMHDLLLQNDFSKGQNRIIHLILGDQDENFN